LVTSGVLALLCWTNFEYFLPAAFRDIEDFRITHFHSSHVTQRRELIHIIPLKDNTKLFYQSYNPEKHQLFDVVWVKSLDEIWRIKFLNADPKNPTAEYADHLVRNSSGFFEKTESFPKLYLSDLKWHPRQEQKGRIRFEQQSLSDLFRLRFKATISPYEIPKIGTALFFKFAIPLLSPLLVITVAPFCLIYNRQRHLFLIYALGLFGLFAFYMLLDSLTILSENGVMSPTLAIFFPLGLSLSLLTWRYYAKT
jgi:lipopolysaccharide export system permease protein